MILRAQFPSFLTESKILPVWKINYSCIPMFCLWDGRLAIGWTALLSESILVSLPASKRKHYGENKKTGSPRLSFDRKTG